MKKKIKKNLLEEQLDNQNLKIDSLKKELLRAINEKLLIEFKIYNQNINKLIEGDFNGVE